MRIVAGRFRGRPLVAPEGLETRPTTDRIRESLFNILSHRHVTWEGVRILDLFAGSGALGLEALSRGASFALFVETNAAARGALRRNIEALELMAETRVFRRDATDLGPIPRTIAPFTLVFCDPPYGKGIGEAALANAARDGWIAPHAVVVVEESSKSEIAMPSFCVEEDRRKYGNTQILVARYSSG